MDLHIREADISDSALILSFIKQLAEFEGMGEEVTVTEAEIRESLFGGISQSEMTKKRWGFDVPGAFDPKRQASVLIAEIDGNPAAFAVFYPVYSTFSGRQNLFLEDLFVKEEYRGMGIGKALMKRLAQIALQMGAKRLDWYVLEDNISGSSFYKHLGAVPLLDRRTYRMNEKSLESLANGVMTNVKNQFIPSGSTDKGNSY